MKFNATEMKELNAALEKAFEAMGENVKKVQDTATQALDESKKYGTIEGKTNERLTALGETGNKLAEDFKEVRAQVLELHQKFETKPHDGGDWQKSLYDIIVDSPQWKAANAKPNNNTMDPVTIGSFHKFYNAIIINSTGQNQPLVPSSRAPMIPPAEQRLFVRDLLPQATTTTNLVEYVTETAFTNAARPQGDVSPTGSGEGELKAESALTFALSNAPVVTIAHWIPASRQVLSDAQMLQGYISARLTYGLKLEEEEEILTGNGGAGTLNGINNQATAYNRGVTNDTVLDTLLKAILQVSLSNFEASGFVLHPIDWYSAMLLKDTTGRYLFSNPQDMVQPRLWAKPVVATQSQTLGRFTAGAFDLGAQIWDREDANVRISENVNDHFIRNMVVILAEERLALTVYRPTAFVYGQISHAG